MSFGFDQVKKPAKQPERKLDLSGLQMPAPSVPVESLRFCFPGKKQDRFLFFSFPLYIEGRG